MKIKKNKYTNKSVAKAISLIELFDGSGKNLSIKEIAEKMETKPGTIFPIVYLLEKSGYLERNPVNKKYFIGLEFLRKGNLVLRNLDIRERANPYLAKLLNTCGENVHLGVLQQGQVMYIDKKEASESLMIRAFIGKKVPANCTALGKILLAFLDDRELEDYIDKNRLEKNTEKSITDLTKLKLEIDKIRKAGYSMEIEEFQKGGMCIAAPIRNHQGIVIAAISIAIPMSRYKEKNIQMIIKEIKSTALSISNAIGYR
jgi:DNA-binding IclR family transcriptional regulator